MPRSRREDGGETSRFDLVGGPERDRLYHVRIKDRRAGISNRREVVDLRLRGRESPLLALQCQWKRRRRIWLAASPSRRSGSSSIQLTSMTSPNFRPIEISSPRTARNFTAIVLAKRRLSQSAIGRIEGSAFDLAHHVSIIHLIIRDFRGRVVHSLGEGSSRRYLDLARDGYAMNRFRVDRPRRTVRRRRSSLSFPRSVTDRTSVSLDVNRPDLRRLETEKSRASD